MVEAAMALYDQGGSAVVVFDCEGMDGHPLKAMKQAEKVLRKRFPAANILGSRNEAVAWIANQLKS